MEKFDSDTWLRETLTSTGRPRHERLCFLVFANGGFNVNGWGFLSHRDGHQCGLEQRDALELMQFTAYMDGIENAGVSVYDAFRPYFDTYVHRFKASENESQRTSDAA